MNYRVFSRSARNFEEFATARKTTKRYVNTEDEARALCKQFNDNRTPAQIKAGTKWEYERV